MMNSDLTTLERAYELARSGAYPSIADIGKKLKQEGYENVEGHLAGTSIRAQLRQECAEARARRRGPA